MVGSVSGRLERGGSERDCRLCKYRTPREGLREEGREGGKERQLSGDEVVEEQ